MGPSPADERTKTLPDGVGNNRPPSRHSDTFAGITRRTLPTPARTSRGRYECSSPGKPFHHVTIIARCRKRFVASATLGWTWMCNRHPAVRAIASHFALFDAYTDIAFPGGIHAAWFTALPSRRLSNAFNVATGDTLSRRRRYGCRVGGDWARRGMRS